MHPQHFGTDQMDIWIRINLKIRIRILDHFWLKFWHWWRFALSWVLVFLLFCSVCYLCTASVKCNVIPAWYHYDRHLCCVNIP